MLAAAGSLASSGFLSIGESRTVSATVLKQYTSFKRRFDSWAGTSHREATSDTVEVMLVDYLDTMESKTRSYIGFLADMPAGYRGVARAEVSAGRLKLIERETGSSMDLELPRLE